MDELSFKKIEAMEVDLVLVMMQAFYAIDGYPFDRDKKEELLTHFVANEQLGQLWLVLWGERPIGYIVLAYGFSFEYGGKDAFIDELYLVEEYRSKGIGLETMLFVEEQAKLLGVKTLHLEVEKHNTKGNKLYAKVGFEGNNRLLLNKSLF